MLLIYVLCNFQFPPFMETTTSIDNDATQEPLAGNTLAFTGTTPHNVTTRTTLSRILPDYDTEEVFLWLPLIFVILFALIIVVLIVASRFSFRCCPCVASRSRSSLGEGFGIVDFVYSPRSADV